MKMLTRLFLLSVLCLSPFVNYAQDESDSVRYVEPKTSLADLSMYTPPAGFEKASQFNGYMHPMTQASVVLTYIESVNYVNIHKGLNAEYYASNKMTFERDENIKTTSGLSGIASIAAFELEGRSMIRHLVFIGDLNNTLWLSVTFPKEVQPLVEAELLLSYQSVQFSKK